MVALLREEFGRGEESNFDEVLLPLRSDWLTMASGLASHVPQFQRTADKEFSNLHGKSQGYRIQSIFINLCGYGRDFVLITKLFRPKSNYFPEKKLLHSLDDFLSKLRQPNT